MRAPKIAETVFDLVPFGVQGDIRFNDKGFMRAVCKAHPHDACRRQRQTTQGRHESAGRPIGALVHWLRNGTSHSSQVSHVSAPVGSYRDRCAARDWFESLPGTHAILELERARRPGEGKEPIEFR